MKRLVSILSSLIILLAIVPIGHSLGQTDIPLEGLALIDGVNYVEIELGEKYTAEFEYYPENFTDAITLSANNSNVRIDGFEIYACAIGDTRITAEATSGVSYEFTVHVYEAEAPISAQETGIYIQSKPFKLEYQRKESLDLNGLIVMVMYDDGTQKATADYTVSGYNALKTGLQIITVTHNTYTVSFLVSVDQLLIKGDINRDNVLDTSDARVMLRKIIDLETDFTKEELLLIDMNEDGKVNSADVRRVIYIRVASVFTVTFRDHDGMVLKTETVEEGKAATAPANPQREGYVFTGWDKSFDKVTSDMDVIATYTKVPTFTVTFKDHDGTILKTETVEESKAATAPAEPSRDGYIFVGWDKAFNNIHSDLVVTATYTKIATVTVTFKDHDGTVLKTETITKGQSATAPAVPPREGYVFSGWDKSFDNVQSDLIVTAMYTMDVTYTVTFQNYDGTTLDIQSVKYGNSATSPTPPNKTNAVFMGWSGNYVNVTKDEIVKAIYSDSTNVFVVESVSGGIGDTVKVLISVDGSVKTCGFRFDLYYDSALELLSYDNDLDLDVIVNDTAFANGIKLNFSSANDKTKQRDIIELTFKIKDTNKKALPIRIDMTEVFEVSENGAINNAAYEIIDGVVTIK